MKFEKGGGSLKGKPTCVTCGQRHYGEGLRGTRSFFGCGKEGHKVRYCPTIASRGNEVKNVAPNVPKDDVQVKRRFYALRTIRENQDSDVMRVIPCIYLFSGMSSFSVGEYD